MKIGRNDPCYCRSGKKYKKCCIDKPIRKVSNDNTIPIEDCVSYFEYIEADSKKLEKILSKYNIDDVTRAVFCVSSWADNRSAMAQTLTLNNALSNTREFGTRNIKEYSDFKDFFDVIALHLPITNREDLTLNDFGEVQINFDDETFPVILGTGHGHVYAAMNFLPELASVIEMTDDLKVILQYNRKIINKISDSNISSSDENYNIVFEIPSEQFWLAVNDLFNSEEFLELAKQSFQIMGYQICPIEMRHFFVHKEVCYPLYNTSILVDFYKKLLSLATVEEYHRHINLTIVKLIENTFNFSNNDRSRVLVAPRIFDKKTEKPYTSHHLAFMTVNSGRVLVALNKGDFDNEDSIRREINAFNLLHKRNQLRLCETYYRKELHGGYAFDVLAEMPVHFLLIEPITDISASRVFLGKAGEEFSCSALDLFYMLGFMEGFSELIDFIEYDRLEKAQIVAIGGKSDLFFSWKSAHQQFSSGAIEYDLISISYGNSDHYTFEYYKNNLCNYPFGIHSKMFSNALSWEVKEYELGYSHLEHKGCLGFGGEGKMIGSSTFLFLAHNVEFFKSEDFEPNNHTALRVINELNQRLFNRYGETLAAFTFLHGKVLQVLFMPMHYAQKVDHSGFTLDGNKRYVYSDIYVDTDTIIIRYAVNLDELLSAMMNANDKSVESAYFSELMYPLKKYIGPSFVKLESVIKKESSLKKEVGVFIIEQDYYYSDMAPDFQMDVQNFGKARKEIAKVCFVAGAEPGEYRGKEATRVIRKMQTAIVQVFESHISKYNKENLHKKALGYYSTQLHGVMINLKRYSSFKNLEPLVLQEFEEKTRDIREKYRRNLRTAQYLLESNLAIQHRDDIFDCKKDEFENLLALADWLVVLQDNADTCYFTELDSSIQIDHDFRVDTLISDFGKHKYEETIIRKYGQEDYTIKNDERDKENLIQCVDAFLSDTGIELGILIPLLEYLQLEVVEKPFVEEIYPNVFEFQKDDLISDFLKHIEDLKSDDHEQIENALRFITLDCDKLKFLNGKVTDILPFWEREKRDNRFDVKPIIVEGGKYIFSPVVIKQLKESWKGGFLEWYPPFEVGLGNVKIALAKWKKRYEDEMVQDIAGVFIDAGFYPVFSEFELVKRFPNSYFPDNLGDYDVIAVNQSKKEIWIIESKVLQKVGSIYEDQMQQKSFFYQHKDDEKFQRRIDYIRNNLSKVTTAIELEHSDYKIVPFMVTNKLFTSRYKEIGFSIITYHELRKCLVE
ncbi:SEC-C motif-containing protein [Tumebacillus sp. BK434]|uniref:YecA family protein n=1 Tax=Tumebacillus sp. BK434 TaxID=2512169 RepID=UPI0010DBEB0D|nr:SEC-C metal-binding domain-containing protein [Tumebacillus sp. BK434]TCP55821.1 SEC-C motif-containing protein [Tumebacillus sp. BK434]